jgi:hypothetical protein
MLILQFNFARNSRRRLATASRAASIMSYGHDLGSRQGFRQAAEDMEKRPCLGTIKISFNSCGFPGFIPGNDHWL